jgi:TP901 family phage tail tape measure protein
VIALAAGARISIGSFFDSKGIEQAGESLKNLGNRAVDVGDKLNKAFLGGVAAIGAGAVLSIKAFADFDQKMVESTAIMGDLTDVMKDDMAKAAREIGKTTKFGATEAAEAFYFLASAGLDAEAAIGALPLVAAFAQAGNFDLARATDILTDAQSALGLASKDPIENMANMARVSDVMVKAATLANTSVEQLGEAFTEKAGAAVKSAGMDFEGAAAALAVFADSGVKGSAAGTRLTAVISSLQAGARNNADEFEKFGLQVYGSNGAMLSMEEIINDMENAFAGMTIEQRNAALASLGLNEEALSGINLLYGQSRALSNYTNALKDSGGITDEVAKKQMETFNAQLKLLKGRLMDVAIEVGSRLMPHLLRFMDVLDQKIIPAVTEFVQRWLPVLREKFDDARAAIEPVAVMLGEKLFAAVQHVVNWMKENTETVKVFFAVLAGAAVIAGIVGLAASMAALLNPVGLVIAAIAVIAAGLYYAYTRFETFRNVVDTVVNVIGSIFTNVLLPIFQRMVQGIQIQIGILSAVIQAIIGAVRVVVDAVRPIIERLISIFKTTWGAISWTIDNIFKPAISSISGFVSGVIDVVTPIVNAVGSVFTGMADTVKGAFNAAISAVKTGWNAIARYWNQTIGTFSFTVPSWVPIFGGSTFNMPNMPELATGGLVPGPVNMPMPIMAHGGEYVLSADIVDAIRKGAPSRGLDASGVPSMSQPVQSGPAVIIENYTSIERSDDEMLIGMLEFAVRGGRL